MRHLRNLKVWSPLLQSQQQRKDRRKFKIKTIRNPLKRVLKRLARRDKVNQRKRPRNNPNKTSLHPQKRNRGERKNRIRVMKDKRQIMRWQISLLIRAQMMV